MHLRPRFRRIRHHAVFAGLLAAFCAASDTRAQTTITWSATAGSTTFSTGSNWTGGAAPADSLTANIAAFNAGSTTNQPQLTASQSVAGVSFGNSAGDYTLSATGGATLTLGSSGINAGTGLGHHTISAPLALGADATFLHSSEDGSLTFTGAVNNAGHLLTLNSLSASAPAAVSGVISGAGGLTIMGGGDWTFSGANTYTGQTRIDGAGVTITTLGNVGSGASSLGAPTTVANGTITLSGGSLYFSGIGATTDRVIDLTGTGGAITNRGTGSLVFTSDFTASGTGAKTLSLFASSGAVNTISGRIVDHDASNPTSVYIDATDSSGVWVLSGANTYTGITSIGLATLRLGAANALPSGSPIISGGTFDLNGYNQSVASIALFDSSSVSTGAGILTLLGDVSQTPGGNSTFSGNLSLGTATRTFQILDSANVTISAVISGGSGAGLSKTEAGTLILSGSNTFTGPTTVAAGTLRLDHASALGGSTFAGGAGTLSFGTLTAATFGGLSGSTNLALTNSAGTPAAVALTVGGNGDSTTYSGVLSGGGSLTKAGAGTLALSGPNTHSGGTTVTAGTLQLDNGGSVPGTIAVSSGATLAFNRSDSFTLSTGVTGSGTLSQRGSGTLTLGLDPAAFNLDVTAGTLAFSTPTATTGALSGTGGTLALPATSLTTTSSANTTIASVITGSGALIKAGSGTLTLSGTNTSTGGTTVSAGTLQLGNGGATGSVAGSVSVASGATLAYNRSDSFTLSSGVIGSGTLSQRGSGTLTLGLDPSGFNLDVAGGTLAFSSAIVTAGALSGTSGTLALPATSLTTSSSASSTLGAVVSGSGALIKSGSGTLTLSGANTFTGGMTVSAGTIALGASNVLANSGAVTASGGTFSVGAFSDTVGAVTLTSGSITGTGSATLTGSSYAVESGTITAILGGTGALTKTTTGAVTLSGANTYGGGTTISTGTLILGHASALGTGAVDLVTGATLDLSSFAFDLNRLTGSGTLVGASTFSYSSSSDFTPANTFSGTASLSQSGAGTVTLSGNNDYSGGTTLSAGTLAVGSDTALGAGTVTLAGGTLTASGGARTLANAFSLNADTNIFGSNALTLNGAGTLSGFKSLTIGSGATLSLGGAIGQSSPSILIKQGAGTLELTGGNTFTGGAFISAGTVRINNTSGSAFGAGAVTIASGATLTGAGSFSGALQLNGTFSPGNSPGLATIGNGSVLAGTTFIELGGLLRATSGEHGNGYHDAIDVGGAGLITFGGTLEVVLYGGFSPVAGNSFDIFDFTSGGSSTFALLDLPDLGGGLSWDTSTLYSSGVLSVSVSAVPEPSTYAAIFGACVLVWTAATRRRFFRFGVR